MTPLDARLERAPCGYAAFANDMILTAANATLHEMLGYSPGELTGRPFGSLLTVSSRAVFQIYFQPLIKLNHKVEEMFLNLRMKSGQDFPVLLNASRMETEEGDMNECILFPMRRIIEYEKQIGASEQAAEKARAELLRLRNQVERVRGS
ncbi:PAS domain-containing protein [Cohnella candidum]|nr:PAS domain-containing protein [Cohnella candidum]